MTTHGIISDVTVAADVLRSGGILGMPTETVYGLAALARNESAVHRVFDTKGRPRNHPLIIHISSLEEAMKWGIFNETAISLASEFWPGPLTLLVPRTSLVADWVTGGRDTVALRVPSHPIAQQLLVAVADGVVAPSANKFGKVSPTTAEHVLLDLGDEVDAILDGGPCEVGVESTIVECTDSFQILRLGHISSDQIAQIAGRQPLSATGPSRAPGMLESHYAPNAKVLIVDTVEDAEKQLSNMPTFSNARMLHFEDVNEYAERLYSELRDADMNGVTVVIAVRASSSGVGAAVNDRLAKAAADR
jgi:L-threonylcarbamoyladenylate synthase